jgi:hypothetical protein
MSMRPPPSVCRSAACGTIRSRRRRGRSHGPRWRRLRATEAAQRVIDDAVQTFGGLRVKTGVKVEELYREARALRIYEGASEVQKLIISRQLLADLRN